MTPPHSDDGEIDSAGWLPRCVLEVAVRVLPVGHRARYDEEFRGELVELPRQDQLGHALRLLGGCWSLRREVIGAAPAGTRCASRL